MWRTDRPTNLPTYWPTRQGESLLSYAAEDDCAHSDEQKFLIHDFLGDQSRNSAQAIWLD